MTNPAKSNDPVPYLVRPSTESDDKVIAHALRILSSRVIGKPLTKPTDAADYLRLQLAGREHEVFGVLYLTAQHCMIEFEELFRGTLTQTSVYPREVVKAALSRNAAAVIFCHNHPSGAAEPSRADEHLTQCLKSALALIDVRVLDHIVVASSGTVSMAERGLM